MCYWSLSKRNLSLKHKRQKARTYKEKWKGWGDWLGTGSIATRNRENWSFEKAKEYVRSLGLKSQHEWAKFCKSGRKPNGIPSTPNVTYKKYWKGYGDWLGTGYVATFNREYLTFPEAREYVHSLGFKSREEWMNYCRSGKRPPDIPSTPNQVYESEWKGCLIGLDMKIQNGL